MNTKNPFATTSYCAAAHQKKTFWKHKGSILSRIINLARTVLSEEADAIIAVKDQLNASFEEACRAISSATGRVILMGMGKSGHVATKIAATFASTGTAAFFVHPGEAAHGDLGMIKSDDIVIFLSHSGEFYRNMSNSTSNFAPQCESYSNYR